MSELYSEIYAVIRTVPPGRITTYGTIAKIVRCNPRQIGYALAALKGKTTNIPWHRVLNRFGEISLSNPEASDLQRRCLEAEGIQFDARGRVNLQLLWIED